jgi:hypothetical protein
MRKIMNLNEIPITPICTNLRYDGTNSIIYFDIGEIGKRNLPGTIVVLANGRTIHYKSFKKLYNLPTGYSFPYSMTEKDEEIEATLTLKDKSTKDKITLYEEDIRKPMTFNEWEKKILTKE